MLLEFSNKKEALQLCQNLTPWIINNGHQYLFIVIAVASLSFIDY